VATQHILIPNVEKSLLLCEWMSIGAWREFAEALVRLIVATMLQRILFKGRRIPDTKTLGLSYGSFMSRRIGLVMPPFVVAIKSTKV
jgi:hypothetical protein